jgi:ABC-type multidrug transport system fused ATPase/permease subunit
MSEKKTGLFNKALGTQAIKDVFGHTKNMIKDAKTSKKHYIKETFDEAMKRHGIKEDDENVYLLKIYKNLKIQVMILLLGQLWLLSFGVIGNLLSSDYFIALTYTFLTFALMTITVQYGLRCFQIRKKHLGMLSIYMKSPKEWYPKKITEEKLQAVVKEI